MKSLIHTIRSSIHHFLSALLFGGRCAGCKTPGDAICPTCLGSIPLSNMIEHKGMYGLYDYGNPIVSHAVWNLKYRKRAQEMKLLVTHGTAFMSEIIAETLQSATAQELILVPIPQHKTKTRSRGFNQSELIAQWIAREIPRSHVERVLEKTAATLPQSHIADKTSRMKNITGTMHAKKHLDKNKIYIVIDDVTTTGATFLEALRALKSGGARHILCIAVAHGYKRK